MNVADGSQSGENLNTSQGYILKVRNVLRALIDEGNQLPAHISDEPPLQFLQRRTVIGQLGELASFVGSRLFQPEETSLAPQIPTAEVIELPAPSEEVA